MRAWLVGGHIVWVLNVTAYQLSLEALRVIFRMYRTSVRCDFAQDILFYVVGLIITLGSTCM